MVLLEVLHILVCKGRRDLLQGVDSIVMVPELLFLILEGRNGR